MSEPGFAGNGSLKFRCLRCSRGCCARFRIEVSAEEREAILKLRIPDVPPPEQCFTPAGNGRFVLAKDPVTKDCVFSGHGSCRIQSLFGFAAKPLACQVFPLHIQRWKDGGVSAEYRWICPGIGEPSGKKLADEANLMRYARALDAVRSSDSTVYSAANPAELDKVRMVHAGFMKILHHPGVPFVQRLYCAARVLAFHAERSMYGAIRNADEEFAADAEAFLVKAQPILQNELAVAPLPDALVRTRFRNTLCGLLRSDSTDRRHGPVFRLKRAFTQFRIAVGTGLLTELHPEAPAVSGSYFPVSSPCSMQPDAEELMLDFWFGKLDAMHFCGHGVLDLSYESGMRQLLVFAPLVWNLAAGFAEAESRSLVRRKDMLRAVRLADFTFARSPFFRMKSAKRWIEYLARPDVYASLTLRLNMKYEI